ncbi:ABC transporter ATP-binding protein [Nocardioides sp. BP30]|uniref:ABC transporter ATP-binding protein n=1 Tax=Nocardioides sp. BP30 TaxID=3036374 RepID=UPI0024686EF9|nr:ABC transporter ATP-binding protein [Nocardioides sp. BP30]WGL52459.1 ABC transporter ATP-binding protein [Nocardioides sp. BP30]
MTTTPYLGAATALELSGVSRSYRDASGTVVALDDVTIAFPRGSWTAIMGPSGSGKSTLLHCAAGLDRVDSGHVFLGEHDLVGVSERELTILRRSRIGFVFQSFNLIGSLTAAQNVALPLQLAGRSPSAADVRRALEEVGLGGRAGHRPRELSGGQQQRVAIARAMTTRPEVLFADEPTGALDSRSAGVVLDLMRAMADRGQTIVMVTHDPAAAARADSIVFLSDGHLAGRLDGADPATVADRLVSLEMHR